MIKTAVGLQILFALVFVTVAKDSGLYLTLFLIASYISVNAFIYGNTTALVLENFPKNAEVASALSGVVQFGLGALISTLVVMFHSYSLFPIALSLLFISSSSFMILRFYK